MSKNHADSYRQTPWHSPAPAKPAPPEHTEYPKHVKNMHGHTVIVNSEEEEAAATAKPEPLSTVDKSAEGKEGE